MGKKLRKQAEKLGIIILPKTVLYARAKNIKQKQELLTLYIPDTVDAIRDYLLWNNPNLLKDRDGTKNVTHFYLASDLNLYIEIFDKPSFWTIMNPAKHAIQITIYTDNETFISGIANAVNQLWEDGILPHMDWDWIEKQFKINREDCIIAWKKFL